jgi:hypothetical protein
VLQPCSTLSVRVVEAVPLTRERALEWGRFRLVQFAITCRCSPLSTCTAWRPLCACCPLTAASHFQALQPRTLQWPPTIQLQPAR